MYGRKQIYLRLINLGWKRLLRLQLEGGTEKKKKIYIRYINIYLFTTIGFPLGGSGSYGRKQIYLRLNILGW